MLEAEQKGVSTRYANSVQIARVIEAEFLPSSFIHYYND